jgi:hypothetical protein
MALALLLFPRGIPRQVAKSDHIQPFGGPFVSWRWPWWYPSPLRLVLFYENGIGYCKDDDESIIHYLHGRIFQPGSFYFWRQRCATPFQSTVHGSSCPCARSTCVTSGSSSGRRRSSRG